MPVLSFGRAHAAIVYAVATDMIGIAATVVDVVVVVIVQLLLLRWRAYRQMK